MSPDRETLPIDVRLHDIVAAVRKTGAVILIAEPGAGKTTRVPPALLSQSDRDRRVSSSDRVIVLEPRRLAARAAASRIAQENGWTLGQEVGYQVRYENRTRADTRIHVVTEGIFIRRLQNDPFLSGVRTVILDEFHERSIASDLALALTQEIRLGARPELEIVVMSATMDPLPVARFLRNAATLIVEGRVYPVEIQHVEPTSKYLEENVLDAVTGAWQKAQGDALVFLPGIGEIVRAEQALRRFALDTATQLVRLHGTLPLVEQEKALAPTKARKVILATNVAETSLTVPGVDLVVDSGLAKRRITDVRHGIDRLETVPISRHSADQRAGRAGRLGPGHAVRLWSEAHHRTRPLADRPEIQRVDLAAVVLELKAWGVADPRAFDWFERPATETLAVAEELLVTLGASTGDDGTLTSTGKDLLSLGIHPRLGRILLAAWDAGHLEAGATLAALLEERDLLTREAASRAGANESGPSDMLVRLELFELAAAERFHPGRLERLGVHAPRARAVERLRDDLVRRARGVPSARPTGPKLDRDNALLIALLCGFPDRLVRRRAPRSERGRMVGGRGVILARESVVRDPELFLALEVEETTRGGKAESLVRLASCVERAWLEESMSNAVHDTVDTFFDATSGKVKATATRVYRDLPLEEPRQLRPRPEAAADVLRAAARERAATIISQHESAARWLARVRFLRENSSEFNLPDLGAAQLAEIVAAHCAGRSTLDELRAVDWLAVLKGSLPYATQRAVEQQAPATVRIPSGREVTLGYETGQPPVLAARVQELFGLAETPRVAGGRVPVLLHILAPNHRPVQVTRDLKSFWDNTYAQVRKDLRGRYPKHAWPENPWTAKATKMPRRRQ